MARWLYAMAMVSLLGLLLVVPASADGLFRDWAENEISDVRGGVKAIETRLERYRTWFNERRPHQGLERRTPDDIYFDRPANQTRDITGGTLQVRFHDGDRRLPILRLLDAA